MKKLLYLCIILGLCSCTNVDKQFSEILQKIDLEKPSKNLELPREYIVLNEDSAGMILNDIAMNLRANKTQNYFKDVKDRYDVYLGDNLIIPLINGENKINIVSSPKNINYDAILMQDKIKFRSLYQGIYEFNIYKDNILTRNIKISNILKYDFTELNSYQMIILSYNNNDIKALNDNISLHRIAFPNSFRDKEITFMLLDLALKDGNTKIIKDELNFIQKNIALNEFDKTKILMALETLEDTDYIIPESMLEMENQTQAMNDKIGELILKKKNITTNEAMFLESIYNYSNDKNNIAQVLSSWYNNNGNAIKGQEYLDKFNKLGGNENNLSMLQEQNFSQFEEFVNTARNEFNNGNYMESIMFFEKALELNRNYDGVSSIYFDMGQAYGKINNYEKGIEFLKKSLNLEKNDDKKAKIYYNIGILYKATGDEEEARNYFTYIIQNYPNSSWSIKAKMAII